MAAGTLLYVVMFEVLNRERTKDVSGLLQLVGVLLGFGVMLTIECLGKINSSKSCLTSELIFQHPTTTMERRERSDTRRMEHTSTMIIMTTMGMIMIMVMICSLNLLHQLS